MARAVALRYNALVLCMGILLSAFFPGTMLGGVAQGYSETEQCARCKAVSLLSKTGRNGSIPPRSGRRHTLATGAEPKPSRPAGRSTRVKRTTTNAWFRRSPSIRPDAPVRGRHDRTARAIANAV